MKIILIVPILFLVFGCNNSSVYQFKKPSKSELVNKIRKNVANKLKVQKQLHAIGTGAQMMDEVAMIALSFTYNKEVTIEEGRELLLSALDAFLEEVNSNEQIHPYLRNYPFEPKNIEIRIFLQREDYSEPSLGKLTLLSAIDGTLKYIVNNSKTGRLRTIYEESYEKALKRPTDIKLLTSQHAKNEGSRRIGFCL